MANFRSAAAVILFRGEGRELQVFWVRRSLRMAFQAGFHAFPGGQLDEGEDARVCAARELLEEIGVRVDPAGLVEAGRWVTPPFAPRRFDTLFFLAKCPPGAKAEITSPEHDLGEWIRPADALERWKSGRILMASPILHALRCLSEGLENIETRMTAPLVARGGAITQIEMRPGIVLVPVRTPTIPPATHTNCYVIGSDDVIVIDPASPYEDQQEILDQSLEGKKVREIWLTHRHRDHVSGTNHLREKSGAPVVAHPITADDLRGTVHVDRTFKPNETLELAGDPGWRLRVLHTPGHARGHVCVFEEISGSLITGDLMAGVGTVVIDPPEGHMATYMDSLRRVQALPVTALFPAHGPVMADATGKIQEYLDHRALREESILRVWQQGNRELPGIVAEVYRDVPVAMHELAQRSVVAHLEKLRDDGRL